MGSEVKTDVSGRYFIQGPTDERVGGDRGPGGVSWLEDERKTIVA